MHADGLPYSSMDAFHQPRDDSRSEYIQMLSPVRIRGSLARRRSIRSVTQSYVNACPVPQFAMLRMTQRRCVSAHYSCACTSKAMGSGFARHRPYRRRLIVSRLSQTYNRRTRRHLHLALPFHHRGAQTFDRPPLASQDRRPYDYQRPYLFLLLTQFATHISIVLLCGRRLNAGHTVLSRKQ